MIHCAMRCDMSSKAVETVRSMAAQSCRGSTFPIRGPAMGSAITKREPSARNVVSRVCHAAAHRCLAATGKALEDVNLYYVGHKAIDGNDDFHEAASNENAL